MKQNDAPYEVVLKTDRLFLRKITLQDVENLQKIFSDPITMQYYPNTLNVEETHAWIERILGNYEKHGAGLWACHLQSTDEFVGLCGLQFQENIDGRDEVEVVYLFIRKFWHLGLATEAVYGVMEYAKENPGYKRLVSLIRPENIPSREVAGRSGLVPEKEIDYQGYQHIVYVSEPVIENALYFAQQLALRIGKIEGVIAVTLGGSLARGEAYPDSDIDFGIYYEPRHPPSLNRLNLLASALDDSHAPDLITEFGEWGPWINGGGGLKIKNRLVDWAYRDIKLVSKVIEECQAGQTNCHYYPGHPHGFHDYYYLSEIYYCRPLYDPKGKLLALKNKVRNYPPLLKKTITEKYLWEADFSLQLISRAAKRGDVFYVTGCLFRCVACLVQVLFAVNEKYFINEKGSIQVTDSFMLKPDGFKEIVGAVMAKPGSNEDELLTSSRKLGRLVGEVKKLASLSDMASLRYRWPPLV